MKYFTLLVLIILFTSSCNKSNNNSIKLNCNSQIDSITALYFNYTFNSVKSIKCEELDQKLIPDFKNRATGILDAKILDCTILKEIESELMTLSPIKDSSYPDTRISVNIFYRDGTVKRICIDDMSPNQLYLDNIRQKNNNHLLYLIKNNIGYYTWFENPEEYMDELKDTTFIKEPFIESPYYKQYKTIENKDE